MGKVMRLIALLTVATVSFAKPLNSFAKTGAEHLADINRMFGNEFKGDACAEEVFKYISQGMDYGAIGGPVRLEKPGSSFLKAIREEFPLFTGKHREFAHWGANGAIPQEVLADFGSLYPGKEEAFISRWQKFILTRREATRQMFGLRKEGARVAQSVFSLVNTRHILGDWTTADPSGLRSVDGLVEDIDKSLKIILGRRSQFAKSFSDECVEILRQDVLTASGKAIRVADKLDTVWPHIKPVMKSYGFDEVSKQVKWRTLAKEVDELVAQNSAKITGKVIGNGMVSAYSKLTVGSSCTVASKGKIPRTLRNTSKLAKCTRRFVKWIPYVGIAADVGYNAYEAWEYQRQYERGEISRQERDRNWTRQGGSVAGGSVGAGVGGWLGAQTFKNDNGDIGLASCVAGLVCGCVGAVLGSMAGEFAAASGYDATLGNPYEQACKLAQEGDREAMRFAGEYLWNGKYTAVDKKAAFNWWWQKCARDRGDGIVDGTTLLRVGNCYGTGTGTEKNVREAVYFWEWSGTVEGALMVAKSRLEGADVAQSYNEAIANLNYCVSRNNDEARSLLIEMYEEAKEGWFVNDPECCYVLGVFHANGCSCVNVEKDIDKAVMMIEDAAEAGYPAAINHMGVFYDTGVIGEVNLELAARHYQLAADKGNAFGLQNFGIALLKGRGVQEDLIKGRGYLRQSEKMGARNYRYNDDLRREVLGDAFMSYEVENEE